MYHILINPASRSGEGLRLWAQAEPVFRESGREYQVHFSTEDHGIRELAEEITGGQNPVDLVVIGGDGTLNEAINGIRDLSRVRIGFIPIGSGNDFARDAGISMNISEAARSVVRDDNHRLLDLGIIRWNNSDSTDNKMKKTRRFIISSGIGFDAQTCWEVDHSRWKKLLNKLRLGKLIYILVAVRLILTAKRANLTVTIDQDPAETKTDSDISPQSPSQTLHFHDCLFAVAMNHRFEGGGFMFAPDASPTDGMLDFCVASGISRLRFFILFPRAYSGGHVRARGVHIIRGGRIGIRSDIPLYIHTDGEVPDQTDQAEMVILPGAIHFLN